MSDGSTIIESIGGEGERVSRTNVNMIRRAIRNDWPITPELREKVVTQMARIVDNGDYDRDRIAASKVLMAADSINAKRESMDLAAEKTVDPSVQVNVGVSIQSALQSIDGKEPEYQEWRREQALRSLVGPALVGCNGYTEQILGAPSSTDSQSVGDADNSGG